MQVPVVAVVLMFVLAGCAGAGDDSTEEGEAPLVEAAPGVIVAADRGALAGLVRTDAGAALQDARVSVAGTPFFTDTGQDGGYRFVNVTPGTHQVRVEAKGFQVHEVPVEVAAGSLVWHNVTLLPEAGRGAGYLPHAHDYWRGQPSRLLVDEEVDLRDQPAPSSLAEENQELNRLMNAALYSNVGAPRYRVPLPEDAQDPRLVYPGTGEVQVTLTWTDGPPMPPTYALSYRSANSSIGAELPAGPSGTTWSIDVSQDMTDSGHQAFSLWDFFVVDVNDARTNPTGWRPVAVTEPVHIKIEAFRGDDPPLEPAHRDFWGKSDTRVVREGDDPKTSAIGRGTVEFRPDPEALVPPGTDRLRMELRWHYLDVNGTPVDEGYDLYWVTGDRNPNTATREDWQTADPVQDGDYSKVYEVALDEGGTDAFYQKKSNWRWFVVWDDGDPGCNSCLLNLEKEPHRSVEFHLRVVAQNDDGA